MSFETADAMGANFINTCLEKIASIFQDKIEKRGHKVEIIMSILSNYTPNCIVECKLECHHDKLDKVDGITPYHDFIKKFESAIDISQYDVSRAVTHNKGIFNGIDAAVIATGNDFRAIEAAGHAYAARNGKYSGLTRLETANNIFSYTLEIPLALGTVGGVTSLHPESKWAMQLLGNPSISILMAIVASVGMANNFSAVKALVTKGIQHGHMKMHLKNIMSQFCVTKEERGEIERFFENRVISFSEVEQFINKLR
jgi:hydroxymethylglutaryl-CoA reductase